MSAFCAVPGFPPSESDYESFERSWITRDLVDKNGIRRVDDAGGRQLVGRKGRSGNYAGWFVPYYFPGDANVRGYRLRRDEPDAVYKNGQLKEDGKYLSAFGDAVKAYFPVGTLPALLGDLLFRLP